MVRTGYIWLVFGAIRSSLWASAVLHAGADIIDDEDGLSLSEDQAYYAARTYAKALTRLTKNAETEDCKREIENEFKKYLEPLSFEQSNLFDRTTFWSQCRDVKKPGLKGLHWKKEAPPKPPPATPPPPRSNVSLAPESLSILYVMLVHDHPEFAKRIINALNEPMHHFVVHVDKKSDLTYQSLVEFASMQTNLYILDTRVSGVWGGFSLVNATLLGLQFAIDNEIPFDFAIDISGQTYPIKSNEIIRQTLSVDSNRIYMDIRPEPNVPAPELWHHYVECDDRSHRIARLAAPRGMHLFMGSQWFILPRHVILWLLTDPLPAQFQEYAKHIMVADEHYFTTLVKNSPYCEDHVGKNLNYLVFGEWEQELRAKHGERDKRKCNQPDPEHCGRSPTTLTKQFTRSVRSSRSLFARKFDPDNSTSMEFVDMVDEIRKEPPMDFSEAESDKSMYMIRQKLDSEDKSEALCLQLSLGNGKPLEAAKCEPATEAQWFNLGQCIESRDKGKRKAKSDGPMCGDKIADDVDEFCFLKTAARQSQNATASQKQTSLPFCLDIAGENPRPGGGLIGYECTGGWNQHFRVLSDCTISAVQPKAVGVARGMKQPEELTVCAEIQAVHQSKRILKTAYCPNNTAPAQTMAFEFISDYNGLSWKRLRIVAKRGAAEVSSPALLKKKSSMQAWAKDIGGGGIQKLGTEF